MDALAVEAQQNEAEFSDFLQLLNARGCKRYLEIGSKYGGTLARACAALGTAATYVAIDKPHNEESRSRLLSTVSALQLQFDVTLILGDSADPAVVAAVRRKAPFDAVFIDACHVEEFVRRDFENYGHMAPIVALHDISFFRSEQRPGRLPIDVPKVWEELKKTRPHVEFRREATDNGIGVLFRD